MSLSDFTKRFKVSLSSRLLLPKRYWYQRILELIQKWKCYLSCEGETKTVTSRVGLDRVFLRQPEHFAVKTLVGITGGPFEPLGLVTGNTGADIDYDVGGGEAPALDVTVTISWPGGQDVDIRGVMGDQVRGWNVNQGSETWFQWTSLDNTDGGPENLYVNSDGARAYLGLSTSDTIEIGIGAGWYTIGRDDDITITVDTQDGRNHSWTFNPSQLAYPTPGGIQGIDYTISIPPYPGAITHA